MIRVVLAIRSLNVGGAERQFVELVEGIDKSRFDVTVCTMYGGAWEERVRKVPGIEYVHLGKKGRYDLLGFGRRYRELLRRVDPDVIYSFMGEMNLFSLWCKLSRGRLVWGLRASNMDLGRYDRMSRLLFSLQKRFSPKVDRIVANSSAAIDYHRRMGFDMRRATVIPNGIDTERLRVLPQKRRRMRSELGIGEEEIAVGIVARIDPMKGYPLLAEAARRLLKDHRRLRFYAVGYGDEKIVRRCGEILGEGLKERFVWLGKREDVECFYNAIDLYVSSSLSEGFSNTIAEAMACGVPCVVTDVGDSARIVGESGIVVPPGDAMKLAEGISRMLDADRAKLGMLARKRIVENFSIEQMVDKTQKELAACVAS